MAYSKLLLFANNAGSQLAGNITNVAVTANLAPGAGALFPAPGAGQGFVGSFRDAATKIITEVVLVTDVTGDQITMVRAQEGTTALAWAAGDLFDAFVTAGTMQSMLQVVQAQSARVITASGAFALTATDGSVGLKRTAGVAASTTVLPPAPFNGQLITISDLVGNFAAPNTVTVAPNGGQSIASLPGSAVLNVNRQVASFQWFVDALAWSFKP